MSTSRPPHFGLHSQPPVQPSHHHGAVPSFGPQPGYAPAHASWAPPGHRGGAKRSKLATFLIAFACLWAASCATMFGVSAYVSQTPEWKRQRADEAAKEEGDLMAAIAKLERVNAALPSAVRSDVACPSAVASGAPIVEAPYLQALGTAKADWPQRELDALSGLRSSTFTDGLLERASARFETGAARDSQPFVSMNDVRSLMARSHVKVVIVEALVAPEVLSDEWAPGVLHGGLVVVDMATERPICQAVISAESSEDISYGGGVRLRVKGIPTPAIGKTGLADAVRKDFLKNVRGAVAAGARRIGAE